MSNKVEIRVDKRIVQIVDNKRDVRNVRIVNNKPRSVSVTPERQKSTIIQSQEVKQVNVFTRGFQGPPGPSGSAGPQGETGGGILSVVDNVNGTITLNFIDL